MFEKPYFEKNQNILFASSFLVFQARKERNEGKAEEKNAKNEWQKQNYDFWQIKNISLSVTRWKKVIIDK